MATERERERKRETKINRARGGALPYFHSISVTRWYSPKVSFAKTERERQRQRDRLID